MRNLTIAALISTMMGSAQAVAEDIVDKVSIQIFVDQHIDTLMVNDRIRFIDFDALTSVSSVLVDNHPIIFKGDGYYVACITLLDENGIEYPVDLYIFENEGRLTVSDITFGVKGREDFRRLAKSGAVKKM